MPDQPQHETRDIKVSLVFWAAVVLVVAITFFSLLTTLLFRVFHRSSAEPVSRIELQPHLLAPAPQVRTDEAAETARYEAAKTKKLNSYGWIDRNNGIIRIPIERAMDLVAQRGLPTRRPGSQDRSGKTPEQLVQERANAK